MKSYTSVTRNSGIGIMGKISHIPRRRDKIAPIAIGVLLVALCISHTGCGCILPYQKNGHGRIGMITSVIGSALVFRGGDHLNAYSGMPLQLNDIVRTDSSSMVEISFPEIGQLLLNDERNAVTEIRIQNPSIFISLGKLLFKLKKNLPWETRYVRGDVIRTEFSVRVYEDTVEVEIKEGEVILRPKERALWDPVVAVRGKKAIIKDVEKPQVSNIREPAGDTESGSGDNRSGVRATRQDARTTRQQDARATRQDARATRQDARATRQDARAENIAEIGWLKGKVLVLRKRERIEAREGMPLQSGDVMRTSSSEALVAFPRAGQVQMVPASDNERDTEVEIHKSLVFVRFGKIQVESVANLSWETEYAHGDARRAHYSVQVFGDTVTIAVDEETVVLSPKGGASWENVKLDKGMIARIKGREMPEVYKRPQRGSIIDGRLIIAPGTASKSRIERLKGDVKVFRDRKSIEAYKDFELQPGDEVRSSSGGYALISLRDIGVVELDPRLNAGVQVQDQSILVYSGKALFKLDGEYSWSTTYVRGDGSRTEFSVYADKDTVTVGVTKGSLKLSPNGGASWRAVTVPAGKAASVYGRREPVIYDIPK